MGRGEAVTIKRFEEDPHYTSRPLFWSVGDLVDLLLSREVMCPRDEESEAEGVYTLLGAVVAVGDGWLDIDVVDPEPAHSLVELPRTVHESWYLKHGLAAIAREQRQGSCPNESDVVQSLRDELARAKSEIAELRKALGLNDAK